ncbi:FAD-binding domain-containing protein [Lactarius deliciosus]|nr:FAD-binding domain-containing protein [Lactarius deliciosus]
MLSLFLSVTAVVLAISLTRPVQVVHARCRNQPGDPGYPAAADWSTLNNTISGRLLRVVPSVEACRKLGCTEAQWASGIFRQTIPGAMNAYNWEQDYTPPAELCLLNGTTCAQGDVPLYAVNATTAQHIQAGVRFARAHDLRVVIKSSGHDYLGRSTAKNSLLLWTAYFRDITFTDHFLVGGADQGSAVTVGSGVGLKYIYAAAKAQNKMFVGGTAATVSAAGGYTQGAGHSAFSPIYGLAADNVLPLFWPTALTLLVNSASFPNLFWALRGGGAGSWGVIIDATFRTFPIFSATLHSVNLLTATVEQTGDLMTLHAKHISDWDNVRAGQYFYLAGSATNSTLALSTVFKDLDGDASKAQMSAFLSNATVLGAIVQGESTITAAPNDIVGFPDDQSGYNVILSSRLIPKSIYVHSPSSVGACVQSSCSRKVSSQFLGISSLVVRSLPMQILIPRIHPAWRVAKTHLIATQRWDDTLAAS